MVIVLFFISYLILDYIYEVLIKFFLTYIELSMYSFSICREVNRACSIFFFVFLFMSMCHYIVLTERKFKYILIFYFFYVCFSAIFSVWIFSKYYAAPLPTLEISRYFYHLTVFFLINIIINTVLLVLTVCFCFYNEKSLEEIKNE